MEFELSPHHQPIAVGENFFNGTYKAPKVWIPKDSKYHSNEFDGTTASYSDRTLKPRIPSRKPLPACIIMSFDIRQRLFVFTLSYITYWIRGDKRSPCYWPAWSILECQIQKRIHPGADNIVTEATRCGDLVKEDHTALLWVINKARMTRNESSHTYVKRHHEPWRPCQSGPALGCKNPGNELFR